MYGREHVDQGGGNGAVLQLLRAGTDGGLCLLAPPAPPRRPLAQQIIEDPLMRHSALLVFANKQVRAHKTHGGRLPATGAALLGRGWEMSGRAGGPACRLLAAHLRAQRVTQL